jgi:hypothetical protein
LLPIVGNAAEHAGAVIFAFKNKLDISLGSFLSILQFPNFNNKTKQTMWIEIICGLVIYKLVRRFFYDDEFSDVETSDSTALFSVAHRLEKLYGGKAYVGLRIPDADTASRQDIDVVLVTKGDVVVISVKNLSGIVTVTSDGSWVCEGGKHHTTETFPDPLAEVKKQASVLESYLEQRGVTLLEGNVSCKVVIPNPSFRYVIVILATVSIFLLARGRQKSNQFEVQDIL